MTIMIMAGVAAAGAGLGVKLGRAAIAEINPIFYTEPPSGRFFADLTPNRYALAVADGPADFRTNDPEVVGGPGCFRCTENLVDPLYAGFAPPTMDAPPDPPADIVRYASFPVSQEEMLAAPAVADHGGTAGQPADSSAPLGM